MSVPARIPTVPAIAVWLVAEYGLDIAAPYIESAGEWALRRLAQFAREQASEKLSRFWKWLSASEDEPREDGRSIEELVDETINQAVCTASLEEVNTYLGTIASRLRFLRFVGIDMHWPERLSEAQYEARRTLMGCRPKPVEGSKGLALGLGLGLGLGALAALAR